MRVITLCAILFSGFVLNAAARTEFGTIVVLNSSQNEVVVAADSRSTVGARHFDDRCKITALGNSLLFAASGYTGEGTFDAVSGRPLHLRWDTHRIAREEFLRLARERETRAVPLELARAWGGRVTQRVESDLASDRNSVLASLDGDVVTSAVFAGFDEGALLTVTAQITYVLTRRPQLRFQVINVNRSPRAVFLGEDAVAEEFVADQTKRAKAWNAEAKTEATSAKDQVAFYSKRFAQLSVRYDRGKTLNGRIVHDLGGPIDVVRLRRGGGIDWIERKPNCPAD